LIPSIFEEIVAHLEELPMSFDRYFDVENMETFEEWWNEILLLPVIAESLQKINFDIIYLITPFLLIYKLWVLLDLADTTN